MRCRFADGKGRMLRGTCPWIDGTLQGPDHAMELLAMHLHRLGAAGPSPCRSSRTCISDHYATAESVWSSISRHSGEGTSAPEAPETRCCHICNRNAPSMSLNVGVTLCGYHERCRSTCAPA